MNGIELTDTGRKNLRKIIDKEFPLTIYCNRLERRWKPKFSTLFGDELQTSAVKKWMDSDIQSIRPQSVKSLANHYFGGLFPSELEEWLNTDHCDIELAIYATRKKVQERKQIQAQLNPNGQIDLSQVPTESLLGELVIRFQQLNYLPLLDYGKIPAHLRSHLFAPSSIGLLTEPIQARLVLTLSDAEKKILRDLIRDIQISTETLFFDELEDHLPVETVESLFDNIVNEMNGVFSRDSLDILAQQIYRVEQYHTDLIKFNFYHKYPNWDTFRKDLSAWMSTGKKTKCNDL